MLTYDPSVSDLSSPIPVAAASMPVQNEETSSKRTVPTGLLRDVEPEKPRRISNGGVFVVD